MMRYEALRTLCVGFAALLLVAPSSAQQFPTNDLVFKAIWEEGTTRGQTVSLAQTLLDSSGTRLTGTPGQEAAADRVVRMYSSWGVDARNEIYGTWRGWRRGITHVDLVEWRQRTWPTCQDGRRSYR